MAKVSLASLDEKLASLSTKYKTDLSIEYLDTGSIILNKISYFLI